MRVRHVTLLLGLLGGSLVSGCPPKIPANQYALLAYALDDGERARTLVGAGVTSLTTIIEPNLPLRTFELSQFCPARARGGYELDEEVKRNAKAGLGSSVASACGAAIGLNGSVDIESTSDISIEWQEVVLPDACHWKTKSRCCPLSDDKDERSQQYGACGDQIITAVYKTKLVAKARAKTDLKAGVSRTCADTGGTLEIRSLDNSRIKIVSEGWNVVTLRELHQVCDSLRLRECGAAEEACSQTSAPMPALSAPSPAPSTPTPKEPVWVPGRDECKTRPLQDLHNRGCGASNCPTTFCSDDGKWCADRINESIPAPPGHRFTGCTHEFLNIKEHGSISCSVSADSSRIDYTIVHNTRSRAAKICGQTEKLTLP